MKLTLKIWRQKNFETKGRIVNYEIDNISPDMSFLEMLDVLNADLISKDEDPCLLYTSPSPRDRTRSRMPSSA